MILRLYSTDLVITCGIRARLCQWKYLRYWVTVTAAAIILLLGGHMFVVAILCMLVFCFVWPVFVMLLCPFWLGDHHAEDIQTVWTQNRLLIEEQSVLGSHCLSFLVLKKRKRFCLQLSCIYAHVCSSMFSMCCNMLVRNLWMWNLNSVLDSLPRGAMRFLKICDCGISWSFSFVWLIVSYFELYGLLSSSAKTHTLPTCSGAMGLSAVCDCGISW